MTAFWINVALFQRMGSGGDCPLKSRKEEAHQSALFSLNRCQEEKKAAPNCFHYGRRAFLDSRQVNRYFLQNGLHESRTVWPLLLVLNRRYGVRDGFMNNTLSFISN
ncbi:hypothetical protein CDAR_500611 [Caerostris darwini]|uniref:Uncharacterized protein n=1 Tax=Caerostris darwini TaxID=1538125 RepID=A0AAV4PF20_9ARAC|nr:hypothetical protein CDAR_500611 [Caerostris darwini]